MPAPQETDSDRLSAIVRKHGHDVRNFLNSLDLEAAMLGEIMTDPEALESVQRMRRQISQIEHVLRSLAAKFVAPERSPQPAAELFQLWKYHAESLPVRLDVDWESRLDSQVMEVDSRSVLAVLRDMLVGARVPGGQWARVTAWADEDHAVFEIRSAASDQDLGREGNSSPRAALDEWQEHARVIEANGGKMERQLDTGHRQWVTRLIFPIIHIENNHGDPQPGTGGAGRLLFH